MFNYYITACYDYMQAILEKALGEGIGVKPVFSEHFYCPFLTGVTVEAKQGDGVTIEGMNSIIARATRQSERRTLLI